MYQMYPNLKGATSISYQNHHCSLNLGCKTMTFYQEQTSISSQLLIENGQLLFYPSLLQFANDLVSFPVHYDRIILTDLAFYDMEPNKAFRKFRLEWSNALIPPPNQLSELQQVLDQQFERLEKLESFI